ncbi:pyruvate dehydrogenase (acetyl-transferring) E1 component subunit alpha [Verrucomicrobium sp. 3C]|uniref:pyruvate dehydrogenase (acetyl-transferring) E1 component subunit alpha n=1 Tax=Verrucomicrobium sp. 3C TaxID=1134055 RepID=UPI00035D624F|nr:pyruvate dehydrogenase (acetyl-transferring) E1 component subunit alpha [Verrucomicrobium sp. 3C]
MVADDPAVAVAEPKVPASSVTPEIQIELYRLMVRIRRFEEKSAQAFMRAAIKGFCHLYIGQEAVAAGALSVLEPRDAVITAYRDHGIALARGTPARPCMAELFGKQTGCSHGMGGSMHLFDRAHQFYGGHAIVGSHTAVAAGLAFAQQYENTEGVTLCLLGEGAVNQGVFAETLNLVSLWKLPIVFLIENNDYAMGTSVSRSSAGLPLVNRGSAFDMAGRVANGMDVEDVRAKVAEAINLARTEHLPSLLEVHTYRYRGHSMSDPDTYRTKEEIEEHKKGDPILLYRRRLEERHVLSDTLAKEIDEKARAEVQDALSFAEQSPEPDLDFAFSLRFSVEDQIDPIPRPRYSDL